MLLTVFTTVLSNLNLPLISGNIERSAVPLSGRKMLKRFEQAGWIFIRQKGSHVTVGKGGARATIPMHRELAKGIEHVLLKCLQKNEADQGEKKS